MQLFVIEAYGRIITMTSKSAKETEKMICVEWEGKFPYTTRLKKDKEYSLINIVGDDFSMWGRDSVKLAKEFSSAMKELLLEKETLVSHIKSYISAEITFSASSAKSDKKDKPKKKHCLKIIKHSKV